MGASACDTVDVRKDRWFNTSVDGVDDVGVVDVNLLRAAIVTWELIFLSDFSILYSRYWWLELKCVFQRVLSENFSCSNGSLTCPHCHSLLLSFDVLVGVFYIYIIWTFSCISVHRYFWIKILFFSKLFVWWYYRSIRVTSIDYHLLQCHIYNCPWLPVFSCQLYVMDIFRKFSESTLSGALSGW